MKTQRIKVKGVRRQELDYDLLSFVYFTLAKRQVQARREQEKAERERRKGRKEAKDAR